MKWIRREITYADIVIFVFLIAGFFYTTNYKFDDIDYKISRIEEEREDHLEYQFRPLRDRVKESSDRIIRVEGNYENIRNILNNQKKNQDERFTSIEQKLEYIINRLDQE